jgi:hypothetical protein
MLPRDLTQHIDAPKEHLWRSTDEYLNLCLSCLQPAVPQKQELRDLWWEDLPTRQHPPTRCAQTAPGSEVTSIVFGFCKTTDLAARSNSNGGTPSWEANSCLATKYILSIVLSYEWVTIDEAWLRYGIYWPLTGRNYK